MSTSSINNLSSSYLQQILASALQNASSTTNNTGGSLSGVNALTTTQTDNGQLSPFAQLMNTLQQLQQSNPAEYQKVTEQIATNLKSAAQTDQADGNTAGATALNQLAADFMNASTSGQMPNVQDLAQALGGHHHHHHHFSASADTDTNSSTTNSSSTSQLLSAFQANGAQNSLNPMNIIFDTLSSAGINLSQ